MTSSSATAPAKAAAYVGAAPTSMPSTTAATTVTATTAATTVTAAAAAMLGQRRRAAEDHAECDARRESRHSTPLVG